MSAGQPLGRRLAELLLERSGAVAMQVVAWWYYLQQSLLAGVYRVLGYALLLSVVTVALVAVALTAAYIGARWLAGDGTDAHTSDAADRLGAVLRVLDRTAPLTRILTREASTEAHRVVSYPAWTAAVLALAVSPATEVLAPTAVPWVLVVALRHGLMAGAIVAGLAQVGQLAVWLSGHVTAPIIETPTVEGWT